MLTLRRPFFRYFFRRAKSLFQRFLPEWRLIRNTQWQSQPTLLQPWPVTKKDRHPELFALAAEYFRKRPAQILSFGCATGEEAYSIATYVPSATVLGVDINVECIAKAKRRTPISLRSRVQFKCCDAVPEDGGQFDAIFCLSVLRHGRLDREQPESCEAILPFRRFAEVIAGFDRTLKPGGLLFLWGANFRFSDSPVASQYRAILVPDKRPEMGAIYGPDEQFQGVRRNDKWVFEKLA
jgi:SAM-dependent methyltransferase